MAAPGGYGHGGKPLYTTGYSYGHGFWGHGPSIDVPLRLFQQVVTVAGIAPHVTVTTQHRGNQQCRLMAGGQAVLVGGYGHSSFGHGPYGGAIPGGFSRGAYGHGTYGHGPFRPGRSVLLIIDYEVTVDRAEAIRWDVAAAATHGG